MRSVSEMKLIFDQCREEVMGQPSKCHTETLFSNAVTKNIDNALSDFSVDERQKALELLEAGDWEYYHDPHDYDSEPFNEEGLCRHGFDFNTCPCGCDVAGES